MFVRTGESVQFGSARHYVPRPKPFRGRTDRADCVLACPVCHMRKRLGQARAHGRQERRTTSDDQSRAAPSRRAPPQATRTSRTPVSVTICR